MTNYSKILTEEGFKKAKDELAELKKKSKAITDRIEAAIQLGDLKENSEYHDAKDDQKFVLGRILEIEELIRNATVIKNTTTYDSISIGNVVTVELENGTKKEFTIVSFNEADPLKGKISNESPLGSALMGLKEGDIAKFNSPKGEVNYKIVKIK